MYTKLRFLYLILTFAFISPISAQINFADLSLRSAKQRANISDMLIFVDTYAEWCHPCKEFDLIFTKRDLAKYFNRHFINVKVDMDGEHANDFRNNYQIAFLPTILFLDKDGKVIFKIDKLIDEVEVMNLARMAVNGTKPISTPPPPPVYTKKETISKPTTVESINTTVATEESKPKPIVKKEEAPVVEEVVVNESEILENNIEVSTEIPKGAIMKPLESPDAEDVVANEDEKVLYVLDGSSGTIPPEILFEEAYFRIQFNDGSHLITAKKYLNTQSDWSSEKNMKFIYDFLYDTNTAEFDYFLNNRIKYNELLGEETVNKTLDILISNKLYSGFPRPTLEESVSLFQILNAELGLKNAYHYFLERLISSRNKDRYTSLATDYIYNHKYFNDDIALNYIRFKLENDTSKKSIKEYSRLFNELVNDDKGYLFHFVDASLQYHKGKKQEAEKAIQEALSLTDNDSTKLNETQQLLERIESL